MVEKKVVLLSISTININFHFHGYILHLKRKKITVFEKYYFINKIK